MTQGIGPEFKPLILQKKKKKKERKEKRPFFAKRKFKKKGFWPK
jgi:hypothetical protein